VHGLGGEALAAASEGGVTAALTDGQVAEGLADARQEMASHSGCGAWCKTEERPVYRIALLALALQERLREALETNATWMAQAKSLEERLQAAEAERDEARKLAATAQAHGEELGALDCSAHADHIAAMHEQLKCSCNYDRKGDVCMWHNEMISTARQQARREAFEEAAKEFDRTASIKESAAGQMGIRLSDITSPMRIEAYTYRKVAAAIRALAEVER
jgi:hypothetical protein